MNQWVKLSNSGIVMKDHHAFMVDEKNDRIMVIDTAAKQVVREIDVGWFPRAMVPTPNQDRLYVTNALANSVSAVNTEEMAVKNTIKTGRMPWNGKPSPQGDRVYVANLKSDDVSVINTKNDTVIETVKVGQGPWGIAVSSDGHRMYVSNQDSRNVQVIDTGSYSIVDVINVGTHPRDIALAPDDDKKLYAIDTDIASDELEIYVIDLEDARIVKALNVPTTDDPLLSRFEKMNLQDKMELMGSFAKSNEKTEKHIAEPKIGKPPTLAFVPHSSSPSLRPVTAKRDAITEQARLFMGGPAALMGPEPVMKAYAKAPTPSSAEPLPLTETESPVESEAATPKEDPEQEKPVLQIIVVVKRDTLWKISMDNYGVANSNIFKAIQDMNPAIKDINKIYVGQEIKLPAMDVNGPQVATGKSVVVKPNDNLFRIALSNYGMVNEQVYTAILRANPHIKNAALIIAGQKIVLPSLSDISSGTRA
jgi:YVTN family beta-propeller protein